MKLNNNKIRTIEIDGFKVDLYDFTYKQFYYPQFNGNAEFEVTSKGFKKLRRYLRSVKHFYKKMELISKT